ncbi:transmembrane protein DUF3566 [Kribbella sp. VKM Ac-2571]|uniref:DUF3566 domain-containing protein n=1 Tax=Kribbella sp. VKM Ac-2571 TaxID=2512222 RepID=UPI0010D27A68|nr:DUF3566 domain-containing protein [Kribbella sp. VKM Ac-2571]TDO67340.1 transmembrane protein DUF3566 [Kribbella sp. VKM Ac-2571]
MTNRARPTWPEGAADSSKSQRTAQGGKPSAAPANPASNGRSNGVPSAGGQRTGTPNGQRPSEYRPQARPGTPGVAPVRPQQPAPSTPGRPEPWSPPSTTPPAAGTPSYDGNEAKTESFGDRMNSARQAVLDKAAAVKSDKADRAEAKQERQAEKDAKASGRPQTRKARLRMSRIDPWSVMKTAFLLAIAFGIVTWVAVFIVWSAIGAAGVFDNINSTVQEVLGTPAGEPFRVENYINTGKVMGFTTLLACADVLIITALATLGSFLYNIAATLLGGLEVTLASED